MSKIKRYIERDFTPSEAEAITGVSVALQRDWRRRELIPSTNDGKWARFTLDDIARLSVMKKLSDFGMSIKGAAEVFSITSVPVNAHLLAMPEAIKLPSGELVSRQLEPDDASFIIVSRDAKGELLLARGLTLSNLSDLLGRWKTTVCLIIDCRETAEQIRSKIDGPLMVIEESEV